MRLPKLFVQPGRFGARFLGIPPGCRLLACLPQLLQQGSLLEPALDGFGQVGHAARLGEEIGGVAAQYLEGRLSRNVAGQDGGDNVWIAFQSLGQHVGAAVTLIERQVGYDDVEVTVIETAACLSDGAGEGDLVTLLLQHGCQGCTNASLVVHQEDATNPGESEQLGADHQLSFNFRRSGKRPGYRKHCAKQAKN
ncbi:MAG TPA: hypothetical protein VKU60_16825 [Chloroflexota bacterium]|nr:hypothetical protein [Chloroflexota bacterium]